MGKDVVMTSRICLFCPVYNEEQTMAGILERIPSKIDGVPVELYIVDDGSQDKSAQIARQFTDNVIVLPCNMGVGTATKVGLQAIVQNGGGPTDCVIKFDADGQHDVSLIATVYRLLREKYDVVTCSRFHPQSDQSSTPLDRLLLNMTFANAFKVITGIGLSDVRTGFMGFRMELVQRIAGQLIVERYGIPIELLLRIWKAKTEASFCEVPHPAMYYRNISEKLNTRYSTEDLHAKSRRVADAYCAMLRVLQDLNLNQMDTVLKQNGFFPVSVS